MVAQVVLDVNQRYAKDNAMKKACVSKHYARTPLYDNQTPTVYVVQSRWS